MRCYLLAVSAGVAILAASSASAVITIGGVDYDDTNDLLFNGDFELVDRVGSDFNSDSLVDGLDLTQWQGDYAVNGNSDADGDGDSDGADFLQWQQELGAAPVAPTPSGWYRGANQAGVTHVVNLNGANANSGNVSVGYDTTVNSNQFNPATWADWRSSAINLDPNGDGSGFGAGAKLLLQFSFQMLSNPSTPAGQILAESREFSDDPNVNPSAVFIPGTGYARISQNPDPNDPTVIITGDPNGWQKAQVPLLIQSDGSWLDLRFNQIFTFGGPLVPWQGSFRLDTVSVYPEVSIGPSTVVAIPEPSSALLALIGLSLLTRLGRGRQCSA